MSFQCRSCGTVVSDSQGIDLCLSCETKHRQHEQLIDSQLQPRDLFAAHIAGAFVGAMMQDVESRKQLADTENMKKVPELIAAYAFSIADAMMKERDK